MGLEHGNGDALIRMRRAVFRTGTATKENK